MKIQEFSDQFDVLYNNISSNKAPGLNEYEKSVFLTKAETELLLNHFAPDSAGNNVKKGFDESIIRQADFSSLIEVKECQAVNNDAAKLDNRSYSFAYLKKNSDGTWANDVLLPINEVIQVIKDTQNIATYQVTPISYDEYSRVMMKPFKRPNKWQAWRLLTGSEDNGDTSKIMEVILPLNYGIDSVVHLYIRYVKKPRPIILSDLKYDGVSIQGETDPHGCDLDEIVHEQVLQRAVELAKAAYLGDINASIEIGKRSE